MADDIKSVETSKALAVVTATAETTSSRIKERLNLHLKRRLHQEVSIQHSHIGSSHQGIVADATEGNSHKAKRRHSNKQQPSSTRKPYEKQVEKSSLPLRKHRRNKVRKFGCTVGNSDMQCGSATLTEAALMAKGSNAQEGNDANDDEGSLDGDNEVEARAALSQRDRDYCPDILAMILNAKKRLLIQHAEVQEFFAKVMGSISCLSTSENGQNTRNSN